MRSKLLVRLPILELTISILRKNLGLRVFLKRILNPRIIAENFVLQEMTAAGRAPSFRSNCPLHLPINRGDETDKMRKKYHNREAMVHRMNQPGSPSIRVLSEESGVPIATLYAWLYSDRRSRQHVSSEPKEPLAMTKRIKPRSPSVKLELLGQSHHLQGADLEAFCHRNGVTVGELLGWRDLALSGIEMADRDGLGTTRKEHDTEMAELKADLRRKNDALAEAAALIVLQKKISGLLGQTK
jgi:transposase